ncbi:kinase-interacting family protein-like [Solanum dulcamara]|uniref:kinase-interacting family protein-like n=1 Tax=Solanum dulcamara TaxID=45834 RepID=UPI002484E54D|nr:kinase-interacting family protein-like [Solanum dulcamara]XP_055826750.1 kinase-interacting family protein-like [Solanum dulcamara]XP_055826751.1 kinase-interacting family protein-like [Solanum dulcamara]
MKAKLKAEKKALSPVSSMASSNYPKRRSFSRPSWLLCTVADLDEKMKKVALKIPEKGSPDSFAERADAYYQKRPQLLSLLQELYNSYVSLADRYCQALAKNHNHRRYSSPIPPLSYNGDEEDYGGEIIDSDAESSLSFQPSFPPSRQDKFDIEMIVADLVIRNVDYDFVLEELNQVERQNHESSRKIELQKSLLDVMESERLILLNENARLGYKVATLMDENKAVSSESLFMKRKAAELARCILKMREDHRVCMLSQKIEDLQGQIYGLEKRNKEYYDQLVKHEEEKTRRSKSMKVKREVSMKYCFKVPEDVVAGITRSFSFGNLKKGDEQMGNANAEVKKKVPKLWDRVKKFDIFFCGPNFNTV